MDRKLFNYVVLHGSDYHIRLDDSTQGLIDIEYTAELEDGLRLSFTVTKEQFNAESLKKSLHEVSKDVHWKKLCNTFNILLRCYKIDNLLGYSSHRKK